MSTAPEAAELYAIHPLPLDSIRQKFLSFYPVGWAAHLYLKKIRSSTFADAPYAFAVDQQMRDQWMFCMDKALAEVVEDKLLRQGLSHSLAQLASHMINR